MEMDACVVSGCVSTCKCLVIDLLATFYELNMLQLTRIVHSIPSPSSWKFYLTHFRHFIKEPMEPFKNQKIPPNLIVAYTDILEHTLHKLDKLGTVTRNEALQLAIVETQKSEDEIVTAFLETFHSPYIQFVQVKPEQVTPILFAYYTLLELEESDLFEARLELLEEIKQVEFVEETYEEVFENQTYYEDESDDEVGSIGWGNLTGESYQNFQKPKNQVIWRKKLIKLEVKEEKKEWSKVTVVLNDPKDEETEIELNKETTRLKLKIYQRMKETQELLVGKVQKIYPKRTKMLEKILNKLQKEMIKVKQMDLKKELEKKVANSRKMLELVKDSAFKCYRRKMNGELLKAIMRMIK